MSEQTGTWVTTPPAEDGWYWVKIDLPLPEISFAPRVVHVVTQSSGRRIMGPDGDGCFIEDAEHVAKWHPVPIQPPSEGEDWQARMDAEFEKVRDALDQYMNRPGLEEEDAYDQWRSALNEVLAEALVKYIKEISNP